MSINYIYETFTIRNNSLSLDDRPARWLQFELFLSSHIYLKLMLIFINGTCLYYDSWSRNDYRGKKLMDHPAIIQFPVDSFNNVNINV